MIFFVQFKGNIVCILHIFDGVVYTTIFPMKQQTQSVKRQPRSSIDHICVIIPAKEDVQQYFFSTFVYKLKCPQQFKSTRLSRVSPEPSQQKFSLPQQHVQSTECLFSFGGCNVIGHVNFFVICHCVHTNWSCPK